MNVSHPFYKVRFITSLLLSFLIFKTACVFPYTNLIIQKEFVLEFYGKVKFQGKAFEDVNLELKKDGIAIHSLKTGRNGKFEFKIPISSSNENNEYIILVSKKGFLTKKISVNTYIPEKEITENKLNKFECFIEELSMIEFAENEIILVNPSSRFRWNTVLHQFSYDQEFAKTAKKEEQMILESPKKYSEYIESKKQEKQTEQKQKTEKTTDLSNKEKEKVSSETDKMNAAKTTNEKIVKENLDTKNTNKGNLNEAVGTDLQLKKIDSDSSGKEKKEMEDAEIVLKIKTLKEIKKEVNPQLIKEKEKEKEIKINKEAKYMGNNPFNRIADAIGEEELKKKKLK